MRLFSANYRLLGLISLILVGGFLTTTLAAFISSRDAIEHSISEQALPLTGDNIYSGLQKDILYPVLISSMMAQDATVRTFLKGDERNAQWMLDYLASIKTKYNTISSFLGSDKSRKLYHTYGPPDPIDQSRAVDAWFFRMKAMTNAQYETNVDIETLYTGQPTLFINHRIIDEDGGFLGVTGVAITLDAMNQVLARYQERFGRNIYFVNAEGRVVLSGGALREEDRVLASRAGMRDIAPAILNRSKVPTSLSYSAGKSDVLVNSRFIPELDWYLVVEQNVSGNIRPLTRIFAINFGISLGVTVLMLVVTLLTVHRYNRRLQKMATTDALTGLLNRQALAVLFRQTILVSKRTRRPLSAILFDIDHFKSVNDKYGHMAGDSVIKQVADMALDVVRESDLVTRWGGEEYLMLLNDCSLAQAMVVAETLRKRVADHDFCLPDGGARISVSLGVAEYNLTESENAFFTRADDALYQAKHGGRNLTVPSRHHEPADQAL